MNTKRAVAFILFCIFLGISMGFSQFEKTPNGLELLWTKVTMGEKSPEYQTFIITIAIKNVSDSNITILTENLQDDLWRYKDKPWELHIDLSALQKENDTILIPLLSKYSPVTMKPGGTTAIRHVYKDRKNVKKAIVVLDMCNPVSDRYHTWRGRLRSELLVIKDAKE